MDYKKKFFFVLIVVITVFSGFLRLYKYNDRWGIASDQARDAVIAREAIRRGEIPEIGPFSSAGNFTTGSVWYIWLIVSTLIFPNSITTPWVVLTISYILCVAVLMLIAQMLVDERYSVIVGLLAAISPAGIDQGFNLTNPSLVFLCTILSLYFLVSYGKKGDYLNIFFSGLCISFAIGAHMQSIYLVFLLPLSIFMYKKNKRITIIFAFLGFIIPIVQYIVIDSFNGFYNLRGIVDYALYGQYKIYVPNRWLTYVSIFWPSLWSTIVGGQKILGALFFMGYFAIVLYTQLREKKYIGMRVIVWGFFICFVLLRYYRGVKFDGYFIFLHPFVLLISSWIIYVLFRIHRYLGYVLLCLTLIGGTLSTYKNLQGVSNYTYVQIAYWGALLERLYPNKKFDIYSPGGSAESKHIPFVLYLDSVGKVSNDGYKIGFGGAPRKEVQYYRKLYEDTLDYEIYDLNCSSSAQLEKVGWTRENSSFLYDRSIKWIRYVDKKDGLNKLFSLLLSKF